MKSLQEVLRNPSKVVSKSSKIPQQYLSKFFSNPLESPQKNIRNPEKKTKKLNGSQERPQKIQSPKKVLVSKIITLVIGRILVITEG